MPIKYQEKLARMEDCPEGKIPIMTCEGIHPKFADFAVKTTHKEVGEAVMLYKKEGKELQKFIYLRTLLRMTQWSNEQLTQHHHRNSKEWGQFCDDVLDFYVVRFILMETPIPIFLE